MAAEHAATGTYFETAARAERLQLLLHLVRNAGEVIYLRAPAGAGKTLFAHRLLDILGDDMAVIWLRADRDVDVVASAADQLGLAPGQADPWPDAVLAVLGGKELLVVVDNADYLDLAAVEQLAALHARGGQLLLIGQGGLAQTRGNWDVQFVDLPPFDNAQSTAFLRSRAGEAAQRINDDMAAALHQATHGLPGPLLDGLNEVLARAGNKPAPRQAKSAADRRGPGVLTWLAGGAMAIILVAVLILQDRVNTLFEPGARERPAPAQSDLATRPGEARVYVDSSATAAGEVSKAPTIELPEVTGRAAPMTDAAEEKPVEEAVTSSVPAMPDPDAPAAAGAPATDDDPLEAVMRDAIAAAASAQAAAPPILDGVPAADRGAPTALPAATGMMESAPPAPAGETPIETSVVGEAIATQPAASAPTATAVARDTVESAGPAQPAPAAVAAPDRPTEPGIPSVEVVDRAPAPVEDRRAGARPSEVRAAPAVTPAPVEERRAAPSATEAEPPAPAEPVVVAPAPGLQVAEAEWRPAGSEGLTWLRGRRPGHYTLQLVGARSLAAVQKFARDHRVPWPHAIFQRQLDGSPWYSLVVGDYPDRAAAVAARQGLPASMDRSSAWPRTFESIQKHF